MDVFLSDSLRRFLCRAGFLALCVIPTALVVQAVVFPPSPSRWAERIQNQLGVRTELSRIQAVSPQKTLLFDLKLGAEDFLSRVTIDRAQIHNSTTARIISVDKLVGSAPAIWNCVRQIHNQNDRRQSSRRPYILKIDQLHVQRYVDSDDVHFALQNVRIELGSDLRRLAATLYASSDELATGENAVQAPVVLKFQSRKVDGELAWTADSQDLQIPVWLVKDAISGLAFLDDNCLIAGSANMIHHHRDGSRGEFSGQLLNVDVKESLARWMGYQWTGQANIRIDNGILERDQIVRLEGEFSSGESLMGSDFKVALNRYLSIQFVDGTQTGSFRKQRFSFRLRDSRFAITSSLQNGGAIAWQETSRPAVICPQGSWHSMSTLLSVLWHPTQTVNREMLTVMQYLPVPHSQTLLHVPEMRSADQPKFGEPMLR